MKHIMISIRPEWVTKILNREKIFEIRKSMPKELLKGKECIVEIYCTKGKPYVYRIDDDDEFELDNKLRYIEGADMFVKEYNALNGKVVARWHLKQVDIEPYCDLSYPTPSYDGDTSMCECGMGYWLTENDCNKTCVCYEDIVKYGNEKTIYLLHIEDLHIYDTPKELADFGLKRPPQSWCYVEEGEE